MATARSSFASTYTAGRPMPGPFGEDDPYPMIRSVLAPEYASLPAAHVESLLASNGLRAEDMEGFFDDVGHAFASAAKAVGPVAGKALPGALSGALAGCALGPWGCLGGAVVGGVGSALASTGGNSKSAQTARTIGGIASAVPSLAGSLRGGGGAGAGSTLASALPMIAGLVGSAGGSSPSAPAAAAPPPPAAAHAMPAASPTRQRAPQAMARPATPVAEPNPAGVLLGLVQHPQFLQALMAMALGNAGKQTIDVGDKEVPVSAFANLGGTLASRAFRQAEQGSEPTEALPDYLYTEGVLTVDPGQPADRAARLLVMLGEASEAMPRAPRSSGGAGLSEADSYFDALDMAELDFIDVEDHDAEGYDGESIDGESEDEAYDD